MSHYKHLTRDERESLLFYVAKGYSITEIARELGRSKSTISRELRRNSVNGKYLPSRAEAQYQKRRKKCRKKKLLEDEKLWVLVRDRFLNQHWSPEEIAGRIDLEDSPYHISYRTIYRGIYSGLFDTPEQRKSGGNRGARRKLRHKGKPRRGKGRQDRRGKLNAEYDIRQRPEDANARTRLGDWEADTVIGKLGGACLLTLVDRKSRFLLCRKMDRNGSKELAEAMVAALQGHPVHTITPDRGKEFLRHAEISEKLGGVPFYFALPHSPWERGTNENTNGLLREFFPKGFDLTDVTPEMVQAAQDALNFRPRKSLGFKTPFEVHFSSSLHLT